MPGDKLKLFISYSRRDMAAADLLVTALEGQDFDVTIDRRNLPYGEEWQAEGAGRLHSRLRYGGVARLPGQRRVEVV